VRVVPLGKHLSALPNTPIDPPRDPNRQPLHRARKRALVFSFHDQVQMIRLNRKLNQPSPQMSLGRMKRSEHKPRQGLVSQARQSLPKPHRHMYRMPFLQRRPAQM
jgi:hypothetical protein